MNEKIKELVEQAMWHTNSKTGEVYRTHFQFEERFAELIIEECLDIAEQTHETKYGKMSCANDDETVRLIKERFGIDE